MNNTNENNKLILEFMGYPNIANDEDKIDYLEDCVKYHSSWDWLMPVIEEIESDKRYDVNILQYGTIICDNQIEIVNNIADISFDKKIEHTYDAIVQFIKEYNQNK